MTPRTCDAGVVVQAGVRNYRNRGVKDSASSVLVVSAMSNIMMLVSK